MSITSRIEKIVKHGFEEACLGEVCDAGLNTVGYGPAPWNVAAQYIAALERRVVVLERQIKELKDGK